MRLIFVADLHYALKQFDWFVAQAGEYDLAIIGGDLLDLASALDSDVQSTVVEKYLERIRQKTRLMVSSGNHDGDRQNAAGESVAGWLSECGARGSTSMATASISTASLSPCAVVGWAGVARRDRSPPRTGGRSSAPEVDLDTSRAARPLHRELDGPEIRRHPGRPIQSP